MKHWIFLSAAVLSLAFSNPLQAETALKVVATTGMVADVVRQVGAERVQVEALMGPGVDPHLYKPTASDLGKLSKADIIFASGLKLEGRMGDVFEKMSRSGRSVHEITDSVSREQLLQPEQFEGHYDPHIWFDVSMWAQTIPTVVKALSEKDPVHAKDYEVRGAALAERMKTLHAWCLEKAAELPQEKRILVTSHDAYNYFGKAYGFQVVGLQGISTVSEASLADVAKLVDFIKSHKVRSIFVESSVSPATIQRVSKDAGVSIGGELFSDAMGGEGEMKEGFDTGTYEGMVKYNLSTIVHALK